MVDRTERVSLLAVLPWGSSGPQGTLIRQGSTRE